MDSDEFKKAAASMSKYIALYRETITRRRVLPDVRPGYLTSLLPKEPPKKSEKWIKILKDTHDFIMPGITHWQHPHFFAYFPAAASYPGVLADMITGAIGANGTSWAACPAANEIETITMDWLARALALPKEFIFSEPRSEGGGVLLTSASESCLISLLTARGEALKYLKEHSAYPQAHDSKFLPRLVAYCSSEAHSCVEKAAMIAMVKLCVLDVDEDSSLRGRTLLKAINADLAKGLHPFFVCATLGTTGCTSFDNLEEIGPIVRDLPACWLHCDAAYGGSSFICPEMRGPMAGVERADSFNINPYKWLLVNFECSALWVKDRSKLSHSLVEVPMDSDSPLRSIVEYRHWGIACGRRFKALKVWFTLRSYGLKGLQKNIRNHCALAKKFEKLVLSDDRFEVVNKVTLGLVCFRVVGSDELNQKLLNNLNKSGRVHMIPTRVQGRYCIRFAITHEDAKDEHIEFAWSFIKKMASKAPKVAGEGTSGSVTHKKKSKIHVPNNQQEPSFYLDWNTQLKFIEEKTRYADKINLKMKRGATDLEKGEEGNSETN